MPRQFRYSVVGRNCQSLGDCRITTCDQGWLNIEASTLIYSASRRSGGHGMWLVEERCSIESLGLWVYTLRAATNVCITIWKKEKVCLVSRLSAVPLLVAVEVPTTPSVSVPVWRHIWEPNCRRFATKETRALPRQQKLSAAGAVVKYGRWKPNRATAGLIFHLTFVRDLFQTQIFNSYYRGDDLLAVTFVQCLFLGNWCFSLVLCLQAYRDEEWRLRVHQTIMQNAGHFEYLYRDDYFYNPCEWKQKDCILFSLIFHIVL